MPLSSEEIRSIAQTLHESDWDQAVVVVGDVHISVGRAATGPVPAATPQPVPQPVPAAPLAPETHVVAAPNVGFFWAAPEPGSSPFVGVGQSVRVGDTLGIVEIMTRMVAVTSDVAGEVVAIHAAPSAPVEYGTPLFTIRAKD